MAEPKYKKAYARELVEYFKRFLDLRDNPQENDGQDGVDGTESDTAKPPASGYPTLAKFAIKIGVHPNTLTNWGKAHKEFERALEFANQIQDDVLEERGLFGKVDGRVAMKILELKSVSKRAAEDEVKRARFKIEIVNHTGGSDKKPDGEKKTDIELKEWTGEVAEDASYQSDD